ncbi:MAG: hypothetical protein K2Z81_07625, partial [Cyanobacteria bacterium]|nr:hypothetical protein [Cyanobacteriota bacterium]
SRRVIPYVASPAMPDWLTPRIVLITILFLLILVGTYAMLAFRSDGGAIKSTQPVEKVKLKGSRARSARKKMVQIYDAPLPHFDKSMALERGYFTFHNLATGGVEAKSPNDVLVDRQSLATLQNRTDLAAINVARSRFDGSGLELVADLPNLHTLDLTDTEVTDKAFENIQRMHKLLGLHVEGCYAITDESLRYLTKLPLRFLNIRRTDIGDLGLSYLKESKTLHTLNMTMARKVTAKGILALRGIKSLTSMNVDFKDRPVEFFEALASLKFPNLCVESSDDATMSDPVIDTLGGFKIINFSKIKFSEEQLRRLSCSKHLNTVSFHMGGITDAHVRAMSNSSFQSIGILEDAIFNDRALLELKKLKHLKEIYLSLVPHVTAKGRELLHKARPDINFVQP